jgi:hypothetical protein
MGGSVNRTCLLVADSGGHESVTDRATAAFAANRIVASNIFDAELIEPVK